MSFHNDVFEGFLFTSISLSIAFLTFTSSLGTDASSWAVALLHPDSYLVFNSKFPA